MWFHVFTGTCGHVATRQQNAKGDIWGGAVPGAGEISGGGGSGSGGGGQVAPPGTHTGGDALLGQLGRVVESNLRGAQTFQAEFERQNKQLGRGIEGVERGGEAVTNLQDGLEGQWGVSSRPRQAEVSAHVAALRAGRSRAA